LTVLNFPVHKFATSVAGWWRDGQAQTLFATWRRFYSRSSKIIRRVERQRRHKARAAPPKSEVQATVSPSRVFRRGGLKMATTAFLINLPT